MSRPIYPALVGEVARLGRSKTGDNQQRDDQRHEAGSSHEGTSRLMIEITNVTWDGNATARPPAGPPQCTNVRYPRSRVRPGAAGGSGSGGGGAGGLDGRGFGFGFCVIVAPHQARTAHTAFALGNGGSPPPRFAGLKSRAQPPA